MGIDNDLVKIIKDEVRGTLLEVMDEAGLKDFLNSRFDEFDFDIGTIILPFIQDDSDDAEFDQLETEGLSIAKMEFDRIMAEVLKAYAIIGAAFTEMEAS